LIEVNRITTKKPGKTPGFFFATACQKEENPAQRNAWGFHRRDAIPQDITLITTRIRCVIDYKR
jgi:hypothetical protein